VNIKVTSVFHIRQEAPKLMKHVLSKGPNALPNCPDDLNLPSATPLASCGCSSIGLPVTESTRLPSLSPSSHCKDANAVSELTTVADVNAMNTADAWRSRIATVGCWPGWMYRGRRERSRRAMAQLDTPRRAILPSPTLDMERRTYPPWRRALMMPIEPMSFPFWVFDQSNTVIRGEVNGFKIRRMG